LKGPTVTNNTETRDELVPDSVTCRDFKVTSMTLWRWDRDPELGFPPPVKIRRRNYRSRRALEAFKQRLLIEAATQRNSAA
jgi:hypothetical protein